MLVNAFFSGTWGVSRTTLAQRDIDSDHDCRTSFVASAVL